MPETTTETYTDTGVTLPAARLPSAAETEPYGRDTATRLPVLVIEDDRNIQRSITYMLERMGYQVTNHADGESGLMEALAHRFAVVVVDVMLPRLDGLSVCRQLRKAHKEQPIILISARDSDLDKITGLEQGADDYIAKPFSPAELEVRIRTLLRRSASAMATHYQVGDVVLDRDRQLLRRGEEFARLTPKEMSVLVLLMASPGRIFTRESLLDQVWGVAYEGYHRSVDAVVGRIKVKIQPLGLSADWIEGVYGTGYRVRDPEGD